MSPFKKLASLTSLIVAAFVIAVMYHAYMGYLGLGYPFNTYLFDPADRWYDFFGTVEFNMYWDPFHNTFRGFRANYPPFSYAVLAPFTNFFNDYGVYVYAGTASALIFVFFMVVGREVAKVSYANKRNSILCVLMAMALCLASYPFQFALDRMNAELILFGFIAVGFIFYVHQRYKVAAIWIGLAAAMKIYPGAFALVFLYKRQYREFAISILSTLVATAVALVIFQVTPFEVLDVYRSAAPSYAKMMAEFMPLAYGNTFFAVIRAIQFEMDFRWAVQIPVVEQTMKLYSLISAIVGVGVLGITFMPSLKLFERLILIVAVILLVPIVSFDYKLLHLFVPMAFWLSEGPAKMGRDLIYLAFFAIMLSPMAYKVMYANVTIGPFVHIFTLSGMVIYLCVRTFYAALKSERSRLDSVLPHT